MSDLNEFFDLTTNVEILAHIQSNSHHDSTQINEFITTKSYKTPSSGGNFLPVASSVGTRFGQLTVQSLLTVDGGSLGTSDAVNLKRAKHFAGDMIYKDGSFRGGRYLIISTGLATGNDDKFVENCPVVLSDKVSLVYPNVQTQNSYIRRGISVFYGIRTWIIDVEDRTQVQFNGGGIVFDGRNQSEVTKNFNEISYFPDFPLPIADSIFSYSSYTGSAFNIPKNFKERVAATENKLAFGGKGMLAPEEHGIYLDILAQKGGGDLGISPGPLETQSKLIFRLYQVDSNQQHLGGFEEVRGIPIQTFGQVNYTMAYSRRMGGVANNVDLPLFEDYYKNKYSPTVQSKVTNPIRAFYSLSIAQSSRFTDIYDYSWNIDPFYVDSSRDIVPYSILNPNLGDLPDWTSGNYEGYPSFALLTMFTASSSEVVSPYADYLKLKIYKQNSQFPEEHTIHTYRPWVVVSTGEGLITRIDMETPNSGDGRVIDNENFNLIYFN